MCKQKSATVLRILEFVYDGSTAKFYTTSPLSLDNPFYNLWPKLFKSKVGLPTNLRVDYWKEQWWCVGADNSCMEK